MTQPIKTYKAFTRSKSVRYHLRNKIKSLFCMLKSRSINPGNKSNAGSIRFIHYHHVFADEQKGFEKQLSYLKNFGDFISMDDACNRLALSQSTKKESEPAFCVSFDDGFKSCAEYAADILYKYQIPAIIYLPTDYIGLNCEMEEERARMMKFYPNDPKLVEFLNWDECRKLSASGLVTFGSHTESHLHLIKATEQEITRQLKNSKAIIEKELHRPCHHFAAPWGKPKIDFDVDLMKKILSTLEYQSLATSNRGRMHIGASSFEIKRDHILANWGTHYIDYFLGR